MNPPVGVGLSHSKTPQLPMGLCAFADDAPVTSHPSKPDIQPKRVDRSSAAANPPVGDVLVGSDCREDDLRLAARLVAGCEQTWREFVGGYAGLVRSRVSCIAATCGLNSDGSLVDDLVAEVFSALLVNDSAALRAYAGRSSLGTYLGVIASRVAIKKSIKTPPKAQDAAAIDPVDRRASEPSAMLIGNEQRDALKLLIDELPAKQRDVVRLFHLEGRSYEQISQELSMPLGSVGPTLKRAEAKLRSQIES